MENKNHLNKPQPAFRTLNVGFSRVPKPRVWVNGRWIASRPFSNTKNACISLKIIEGQGQSPFIKNASAVLGICGNGQAMEEGDLGDAQGAQSFPGLVPGSRALVMAQWLAKVFFVTPSSVLPLTSCVQGKARNSLCLKLIITHQETFLSLNSFGA